MSSFRERQYATRDPRYADLSLNEWRAQTAVYPLDETEQPLCCVSWRPRQPWTGFLSTVAFYSFLGAWLVLTAAMLDSAVAESRLSYPDGDAFATAYVSFLLFFAAQSVHFVVFLWGSLTLCELSSARAVFQRDVTSDGTEPLVLWWSGDSATLPRAPLPSQQRMLQHFTALQKRRLLRAARWWMPALTTLTLACLLALISLVAVVTFISTAGLGKADVGRLFGVHVTGCVVFLTVQPLALWTYWRVVSDERRQSQALGAVLDSPTATPSAVDVSLIRASAELGGDDVSPG